MKININFIKYSCICDHILPLKAVLDNASKKNLKGLDQSNSNSLHRGIVMHTSRYVTEKNCRGNSNGCFVVSPEVFEILKTKKMMFFLKVLFSCI